MVRVSAIAFGADEPTSGLLRAPVFSDRLVPTWYGRV